MDSGKAAIKKINNFSGKINRKLFCLIKHILFIEEVEKCLFKKVAKIKINKLTKLKLSK